MKNEIGRQKLTNLLDDLFGDANITNEEFNFRLTVLGEMEQHMIADGDLTEEEILEIEESWTRPQAA